MVSVNPLSAMNAYTRPAKAIGEDYGRIYAFGKSYQHGLWTHICICQSFRSPTYCSHNYQDIRWIHMRSL